MAWPADGDPHHDESHEDEELDRGDRALHASGAAASGGVNQGKHHDQEGC